MPRFRINDSSGNSLLVEGDEPPTEQEIDELFAGQKQKTPPSLSLTPQFGGDRLPSEALTDAIPPSLQQSSKGIINIPPSMESTSDWNAPAPESQPRFRVPSTLGTPTVPEVDEPITHPEAGQEIKRPGALGNFMRETAISPVQLAQMVRNPKTGEYEADPVEHVDEFGNPTQGAIQIPHPLLQFIPNGWMKDVGVGTYNAVASFGNFMASPQGIGFMAAAAPELMELRGASPQIKAAWKLAASGGDVRDLVQLMRTPAGQLISAGFAVDMAHGAVDSLGQGDIAVRRGDLAGAAQHYAGAIINGTMSALSANHAANPSEPLMLDHGKLRDMMEQHWKAQEQAQRSALKMPMTIEGGGPLPQWARDAMVRQGLNPARTFNDIDLTNPSIVEAIKSDPSLTDAQKAEVLSKGGVSNASQVSQAAAVHGDVLPSGETKVREMPVIEGEQGVRQETQRRIRPALTSEVSEEGRVPADRTTPADVAEGPVEQTGGIAAGTEEPLIQPQGPPSRRKTATWNAMEEAYNAGYDGNPAPAFDSLVEKHGVAFSKWERARIYSAFRKGQTHQKVNQMFPEQQPIPRQQASPGAGTGPLMAHEIIDWKQLNEKFNDGQTLDAQEMAKLDAYDKRRAAEMQRIVENQPAPKLEEEDQKVVDEAAKEEGVKVRVGSPQDFEGNRSGARAIAAGDEVIVSPLLSRLDLRGMDHDQKVEAIKSLIAHEAIHLKTPRGAGEKYWNDLTSWQKKIAYKLANIEPGSVPNEAEYMGREVIARRMQRLRSMTPVEIAMEIHNGHFTRQSLEAVDRIIQDVRETLGTKASRRQKGELDAIQGNIRDGLKIAGGQAQANKRESDDVRSLVERLGDSKTPSNTWDAIEGGLKSSSIADLDALLNGFREWKKWAEKAKKEAFADPSKMAAYAANAVKGQLFKEAIHAATNSAGHTVEARRLDREKALPMPKLDWRDHPDVEQWLREHGKEVGVDLPDAVESANKRGESPRLDEAKDLLDQMHKYLAPRFNYWMGATASSKLSLLQLFEEVAKETKYPPSEDFPEGYDPLPQFNDEIKAHPELGKAFDTFKSLMSGATEKEWRSLMGRVSKSRPIYDVRNDQSDHIDATVDQGFKHIESLADDTAEQQRELKRLFDYTEHFARKEMDSAKSYGTQLDFHPDTGAPYWNYDKVEEKNLDAAIRHTTRHDQLNSYSKKIITWDRDHPPDQLSFSMNRRYGPTKRGQKFSEDVKKLAELRAQAAAKGAYNPLESAHEPVTPERLTSIASEVIRGVPSIETFVAKAQMRHGPMQRGALAEVMNDALVKHLENANGAELERLVDELKLRREVYGTYRPTGSSAKFVETAARYVGEKEAQRLGKESVRVSREGRIADMPVGEVGAEVLRARLGKQFDQMNRLANKVEADANKLRMNLGTSAAEDARINFQINQARMRAAKLREDASRMVADPEMGQSMLRTQSTLFGELDKSPEIKLGTGSKVSSEEVGSAQKMRARAISAILTKVMSGAADTRASLSAKEITPESLAWNQEGQNAIVAIEPKETHDVDALGWTLTRGGRSNAATKTAIAGGRRLARQKGELETVTKRVTALFDQATGKVHLVSTWRRGSGEVRLVNPLGGTMALSEMPKRYTPIYSMMLDRPLKGFHQVFDSREDFSKQFVNDALDRKQQAYVSEEFSPSVITQQEYEMPEGTEGIRGEGGFVIGPDADLVRSTMDNALRYGTEMTEPEARKVYMEFSQVHTDQEAADLMNGLRDRIAQRKLTAPDYLLISAIKKAAASVDERFGETLTPDQKAQQTLRELHDISIKSDNERAAIKAAKAAFGEKLQGGAEVPVTPPRTAVTVPPTGTVGATRAGARELTMRERVPPTVVRDAQGRPVYALPGSAPDVSEVGGGLAVEHQLPPKNMARQLYRERNRQLRIEAKQVRNTRYNLKQPDIIAETPGPRESYEQPAYRRELIARQMAEYDARAKVEDATRQTREETEKLTENPQQTPIQDTFWDNMNKRAGGPGKAKEMTDALLHFGTKYDEWMADRLARIGGPMTKEAANGIKHIIDRSKEAYGSLTPVLDPARVKAGAPTRATKWLHQLTKVTKYAAISRTPDAIEGKIEIPQFARKAVELGRVANYAIGKLLEPVIPDFKASGAFQRNLTSLGYDILRAGPNNKLWNRWVDGIYEANKGRVIPMQHPTEGYIYGVPISREMVQNHFIDWKEKLDDPATYPGGIDRVNQDMRRIYPEAITHIKDATGWHEVIHSNLFNYLETAARRASHIRAFREEFPLNTEGATALRDVLKGARSELDKSGIADLEALMRTLQGHPTDNYNDTGLFSTTGLTSQAFRVINQTFGSLMAKMVLTAQLPTQMGETISGSTPLFLGSHNYLRALAKVNQIYPEMEKAGMVNQLMRDWSIDPNSPARTAFRLTNNTLSLMFVEDRLNEFQEAMAGATAHVVAEKIVNGQLGSWEKSMLPQTFKAMGFDRASVKKMMEGDADLLDQFKRKAATWLTSGNRLASEGSRLGGNRLFNSIFRFQSYPMMKMNQFRRVMVGFSDAMANGTGREKLAASRLLGRFLGGNALQGALTTGIVALALRGALGLNIFKHESQDDPLDFLFNSFMASVGGPLYMLARGSRDSGIMGVGEQASRMLFPYAIGRELVDAGNGFGPYANKDGFEKTAEFIRSKTPGLNMVANGMALAGISMPNRDLDTAISAFYRWRRKELGFNKDLTYLREDDNKEFRRNVAKAVDALQRGDDKFLEYFYEAAGANDRGPAGVKASLLGKTLLKGPDGRPLDDDKLEMLRKRIGDRAYQKLEDWDMMLKFAANAIQVEPE